MRFLNKQTCQKLIGLGCKSETIGVYANNDRLLIKPHHHLQLIDEPYYGMQPFVDAFTLCDFLDTTEQAIQNCKLVFKNAKSRQCPICDGISADLHNWRLSRHMIVDSNDAIAFIEEYVSKL